MLLGDTAIFAVDPCQSNKVSWQLSTYRPMNKLWQHRRIRSFKFCKFKQLLAGGFKNKFLVFDNPKSSSSQLNSLVSWTKLGLVHYHLDIYNNNLNIIEPSFPPIGHSHLSYDNFIVNLIQPGCWHYYQYRNKDNCLMAYNTFFSFLTEC